MRLKKLLFLDSRFFSGASCRLELGPLTEEHLRRVTGLLTNQHLHLQQAHDYVLMFRSKLSLQADFNDFLVEEVVQAFVQLSHDAVVLCFTRPQLSLEKEPQRTRVLTCWTSVT